MGWQGCFYRAPYKHAKMTCFWQKKIYFTKPYQVTTHYNQLENTILISGHSIGFGEEIRILVFQIHTLSGALF